MIKGNIVFWKQAPTANTPGAPKWPNKDMSGIVMGLCKWMNTTDDPACGKEWCEVLWANNQFTRCFRHDLKIFA